MRFLIDADLPRSVAELCRARGYEAEDVRDIGMRSAADPKVAAHALSTRACLVTGDFGFADIRHYPPEQYAGIIVLQVPPSGTSQTIVDMMSAVLSDSTLLARTPGRLAIVELTRVRLRPPLPVD